MDLQSTVLYEFSTIAQALAGAMGLIGAFTIFALQRMEDSLHTDSHALYDAFQKIKSPDMAT